MSRTHKDLRRRGHAPKLERRISVRGVRRDPPDYRKLARALIAIAQAEAEAQAAADARKTDDTDAATTRNSGTPPEAA